jgi:hypothetical protein
MGAEAKGKTLRLKLKLQIPINPEHDDVFYFAASRAADELCSGQPMLEMFLNDEYMFLSYSDVTGRSLAVVTVNRERCGFKR